MVGAVARRAVTMAVQPLLAWQQPVQRGEQVVVGARPDLDDDEPAVACGTKTDRRPSPPADAVAANVAQSPVRSTRPPARRAARRVAATVKNSGSGQRRGAGEYLMPRELMRPAWRPARFAGEVSPVRAQQRRLRIG